MKEGSIDGGFNTRKDKKERVKSRPNHDCAIDWWVYRIV